MQSESIKNLASALAGAQAAMKPAIKDSKNPFFKSNYADLSSVWDAVREPMSKHGLSVFQGAEIVDGQPVLSTTLMHVSGEWIKSSLPMTPNPDPQKLGSQITYFRRYALAAALGVTQEDDDANHASMGVREAAQPSGAKTLTQEQLNILEDFRTVGILVAKATEKFHIDAPKWLKLTGHSKLSELSEEQASKLIKECEKKVVIQREVENG